MLNVPNCYHRSCVHYEGVDAPGEGEEGEVNVCPAFPDGIPKQIAYGSNPHTEVHPDQPEGNTTVYKKA